VYINHRQYGMHYAWPPRHRDVHISACSINLRIAAERTTKGSVQLIVQTAYAGVYEVFIGQLNKLNRICLKVFFC